MIPQPYVTGDQLAQQFPPLQDLEPHRAAMAGNGVTHRTPRIDGCPGFRRIQDRLSHVEGPDFLSCQRKDICQLCAMLCRQTAKHESSRSAKQNPYALHFEPVIVEVRAEPYRPFTQRAVHPRRLEPAMRSGHVAAGLDAQDG